MFSEVGETPLSAARPSPLVFLQLMGPEWLFLGPSLHSI